jgi:hypothetical protein
LNVWLLTPGTPKNEDSRAVQKATGRHKRKILMPPPAFDEIIEPIGKIPIFAKQ